MDQRTDRPSYRDARTHLKKRKNGCPGWKRKAKRWANSCPPRLTVKHITTYLQSYILLLFFLPSYLPPSLPSFHSFLPPSLASYLPCFHPTSHPVKSSEVVTIKLLYVICVPNLTYACEALYYSSTQFNDLKCCTEWLIPKSIWLSPLGKRELFTTGTGLSIFLDASVRNASL